MAAIERLDEVFLEYLTWIGDRLSAEHGVVFDDRAATVAAHHEQFTRELPHFLGPRGRLLVAGDAPGIVGVGALKPIDATTAEIKRMYVRPAARGQGVGRGILHRLLDDARALGYRTVRLETATFMREAHALYRSAGFTDRPPYENAEAGRSGLAAFVIFMELDLSLDLKEAPCEDDSSPSSPWP